MRTVVPRIFDNWHPLARKSIRNGFYRKCEKYLPVVISVQAFMSNTTPFGDFPFLVLSTVISTRDTCLSDGMSVKSTRAGFLLSSLGLTDD